MPVNLPQKKYFIGGNIGGKSLFKSLVKWEFTDMFTPFPVTVGDIMEQAVSYFSRR